MQPWGEGSSCRFHNFWVLLRNKLSCAFNNAPRIFPPKNNLWHFLTIFSQTLTSKRPHQIGFDVGICLKNFCHLFFEMITPLSRIGTCFHQPGLIDQIGCFTWGTLSFLSVECGVEEGVFFINTRHTFFAWWFWKNRIFSRLLFSNFLKIGDCTGNFLFHQTTLLIACYVFDQFSFNTCCILKMYQIIWFCRLAPCFLLLLHFWRLPAFLKNVPRPVLLILFFV